MSKLLIGIIFLGLATGTACQPVIFASSDSPDRTLRCEVIQVKPFLAGIFGGREPWRYHFRIRGVVQGGVIAGERYEYGDGKIELDSEKLEFEWGRNQLTVINHGTSPSQRSWLLLLIPRDSTGSK